MLEACYEVFKERMINLLDKFVGHLLFIAFKNTLLQKSIPSIIFCSKGDKMMDPQVDQNTILQQKL